VITDPEATYTRISVSSKMAARPQASIGAYRHHMVEQVFSAMLSGRFDEMEQASNAPFLKAQTARRLFVRPRSCAYSSYAQLNHPICATTSLRAINVASMAHGPMRATTLRPTRCQANNCSVIVQSRLPFIARSSDGTG
jgi:hypothetical protein